MRDIAQLNAFRCMFFSQITVSDSGTTPQIKFYTLLLEKIFELEYQLIRNTLDQSSLKKLSNHFIEREIFPFIVKTENVQRKKYNLLHSKNESFSQIKFLPDKTTRAINANRPVDHHIDEIQSIQSTITGKIIAQKSNQSTNAGFQI